MGGGWEGSHWLIIYCVRHGESESNVTGIFPTDATPLTQKGVQQAREAAESLVGLNITDVYSSPTLRTIQTASIIAERLGLKVTVDDRLREAGLGKLAGRRHSEIRSENAFWYREYFSEENLYGLEKFSSIVERMTALVNELYSKGKTSVVFVTHLEPIRALVASALGSYGEWIRRVRVSNASISVFEHKEGVLRLQTVNWLPIQEYSKHNRF